MKTKRKSKVISSVLSPALKLWLRSQVEAIDGLELKINGGDGQIVRGHIPEVLLSAEKAVYEGIYLSQVTVKGENIRVNLGQVIRGKALRLLEPIWIGGAINLALADLQASLASALLASGLKDLLALLLTAKGIEDPDQILTNYDLTWQEVRFQDQQVHLRGMIQEPNRQACAIDLRTGLSLVNGQILSLEPLQVSTPIEELNFEFENFQVDLGEEVEISQLTLDLHQLSCQGKLTIQPEPEIS